MKNSTKQNAMLGIAVVGSVLMIHNTGQVMHLGTLVKEDLAAAREQRAMEGIRKDRAMSRPFKPKPPV